MENLLQQLVNGIAWGGIYALIALGYTMVYGVLKLINFAHGEVYMVGAMTGYYAAHAFGVADSPSVGGLLLTLLASMTVCGLLAALIERVLGRSHWQTRTSLAEAEGWRALTKVPEDDRAELGRSFRLQDAGVALEEIESVSTSLAELIQNISNAARQQAASAGHVSNTMGVIQEITSQTANGTEATAKSVGALAEMANEMRVSVEFFKLPGDSKSR